MGFPSDVSYQALDEYFSFQNRFPIDLIRRNSAVAPGNVLTIQGRAGAVRTYPWDYPFGAETIHDRRRAEELHRLFLQGVIRQLISDVPVGSYLSGGMDSGSITSIAARNLPRLTRSPAVSISARRPAWNSASTNDPPPR